MIDTIELDSFKRPKPEDELENFLFETDDVVSFNFDYGNGYPGSTFGYSSPEGKLFISNLRLIFIPKSESSTFRIFDVSIAKINTIKQHSTSLFRFSKNMLKAQVSMDSNDVNQEYSTGCLTIKFSQSETCKAVFDSINSQKAKQIFPEHSKVLPDYSPPILSYEEAVQRPGHQTNSQAHGK